MKHLIAIFTLVTLSLSVLAARNEKTTVFTLDPPMHCANCENKIKSNLRFERGIKAIETSIADRTVTLRYDSTKTDTTRLIKGFARIGYKATPTQK